MDGQVVNSEECLKKKKKGGYRSKGNTHFFMFVQVRGSKYSHPSTALCLDGLVLRQVHVPMRQPGALQDSVLMTALALPRSDEASREAVGL